MTYRTSLTLLMASSSLVALPTMACAQEGQPAAAADKAEDIIVTGSRIVANGNNMPTPVTVVTADSLTKAQPTTILDALNQLPVFSGSRSQQSNPIAAGIAGAGSPASNQLNLRDLGANRTLVLFDGQRVAPTTIAGVVDADIIPQMLIQRVEVVTGGTSAVYGSDAVAGVANFIPDKKFTGVKIESQYGLSGYGDNQNWKAGIAVGKTLFGGRGHIEASFEHYDDRGVLNRLSRAWDQQSAVVGTGSAASPYMLENNVRNNSGSFGGLITSGALKGQQFSSNGVLTPFVHGTATSTSTAEIGGDGYYQTASLVAPLTWNQAYVRGDLDISETVHGHFQVANNSKSNTLLYQWPTLTGLTISATNPFLPAATQAQLAAAGQTSFTYGKVLNQESALQPMITSDQVIANAGFDGKIGKYHWEVSGNFGSTMLHNNFMYNQNNQNLSAALDAVTSPTGQIVCRSTLTNPGANPGCVPLNLFGPTSASQDALNYVFQTTHFTAHTGTLDFNGSISGALFNTWAGPVSAALSAEWRKTSYDSYTDANATSLANCTGLTANCKSNTLLWVNAFGNRSTVSVNVKEAAAEFEIPLIKDKPFFQSLSLNGAVRYTSYSTSGNYVTWKIGGDWRVDHQLRFRATASRDIRAPTLNDLYAPATIQVSASVDQLTNTSPNAPSYRAGNPNLLAEIGRTETAGFVYQPDWFPHFSLTVDGFYIEVKNAIVEVKGDDSVVQQACYTSGGTSPYCSLQTRNSDNVVIAWRQYNINISKVRSWGMDVEMNYHTDVFGMPFSARGFMTYQPHTIYSQPNLSDVDMGGTAYGPTPLVASAAVRVNLSQSLNITRALRVDLQERYRDSLRLSGDSTLTVACCVVPAVAYVDLNLSHTVTSHFGTGEIFLNIQNLFDKDPPTSAPPGTTTPGYMGGAAIGDDTVGRSFVMGLRLKL